jgi:hypothetical protein
MHTWLLVCPQLGDNVMSVVLGFELDRRCAVQSVHEPVGVVPVNPFGGEQFHVGQPFQRAAAKRRVRPDGLGLVEPDRGLCQSVDAPISVKRQVPRFVG